MRGKTTATQVAMGSGSQSSMTLVDEQTSLLGRGRGRGSLYILVEVAGQIAQRDVIAEQLAEVIRDDYSSWKGSVTAGLQNAIRKANKLLVDENRESLPGEKLTAGVSCVLLRDASRRSRGDDVDLFIAQAGPAAVYLSHEGQVTRFPDLSPWLDGTPPEDMDAAALGERHDLNVALFHTQASPNDTVLLVESGPASQAPTEGWSDILEEGSTEAVLEALMETGQFDELSALAVRIGGRIGGVEGGPAVPHPVEAQPVHVPPQRALPPVDKWVAQKLDQFRPGERLQRAGRTLAAALRGIWRALLILLRRVAPGQPDPSRTRERQAAVVAKSKKSARRSKTAAKDQAQSSTVQRALTGIAVAIPIIVAVVVLVTYYERGQTRKAEMEVLWQEANSLWKQALETTDQADERVLLTEAERRVEQLLELKPQHAEAADLKTRIRVLLDELNRVEEIRWFGALKTYPGSADLARVVVEGVHIFVMDRGTGKVYHHRLDELQQALQPDSADVVLINRGDPVGNVVVGNLVDMVWMPVGNERQKANLVILESGGGLLEYDPATGELAALNLAVTGAWQNPKLVGSHFGRFYVLDPTANRIWRYAPTPDGYSATPDEWLQAEVDLGGVRDMAIGDSIYLLYADGMISKLSQGKPIDFDISDWPTPPQSPVAFFTRPPETTQWVYMADRGNSRIVQCSKEGRFKQQFRLSDSQIAEGNDPLAGAVSLFVDEIGGRAYFLSEQTLYMIILPDE
jgi:hypothetical protein